jgi:hypothetical protein
MVLINQRQTLVMVQDIRSNNMDDLLDVLWLSEARKLLESFGNYFGTQAHIEYQRELESFLTDSQM